MNLGYALDAESGTMGKIDKDYEFEQFSYQLYYYVCTGFEKILNYNGKHVLEIGSGRGGGLDFIMKTMKPVSGIGLDYSIQNINFCKRIYQTEGLTFTLGDAEVLPMKNESVDYILCIESSHCFGSFKVFLNEVKRVLKPKGHFFLADFLANGDRSEYEESFHGFLELVDQKNMTEKVLIALRLDSKRREDLIQKKAPFVLRKLLRRFAGIQGSAIYDQLEAGDTVYTGYHFIKN